VKRKTGKEVIRIQNVSYGFRHTAEFTRIDSGIQGVSKKQYHKGEYMKKFAYLGLVSLIILSLVTFAAAKEKEMAKPGGMAVDAISITATVVKVDQAKRMITIKGPAGNMMDVVLGQEVKNFDEIKENDQIKARYVESIAVFVEKSDAKPAASETTTVELAPIGYKPGAVVVDTVEATAQVLSANYAKRTLKLKLPNGGAKTVKVGKQVKKFKQIKKGDEVVVRYTQAVALTVEKP
jgi:Cu/Ag efflux protein CusF